MFLDLNQARGCAAPQPQPSPRLDTADARYGVDSEYGRLQSVLLAEPRHLALVPCNSVSIEAGRNGHSTCTISAARQHAGLAAALRGEGVEVRLVPANPGLPDLAFTRDTSLMTPWGLLGLRPGAGHRVREVDAVLAAASAAGIPVLGCVGRGRVEGGDVAILRPGVLLIGISGERTDEEGAAALGEIFSREGWAVITYRFDPQYLHLDTLLCLADRNLAVACTGVLGQPLLSRLEALGIDLVDVGIGDARRLGCNLLSLGDRRVISAGTSPRADRELARRGYAVVPVDVGEFTSCGGGIHCLTMPLKRSAG